MEPAKIMIINDEMMVSTNHSILSNMVEIESKIFGALTLSTKSSRFLLKYNKKTRSSTGSFCNVWLENYFSFLFVLTLWVRTINGLNASSLLCSYASFATLLDGCAPCAIHFFAFSISRFIVWCNGSNHPRTSLYPDFTGLACSVRTIL